MDAVRNGALPSAIPAISESCGQALIRPVSSGVRGREVDLKLAGGYEQIQPRRLRLVSAQIRTIGGHGKRPGMLGANELPTDRSRREAVKPGGRRKRTMGLVLPRERLIFEVSQGPLATSNGKAAHTLPKRT